MRCALVCSVILLMPLLVLKNGLDSCHNQHKSQCCCRAKATKWRHNIPPGKACLRWNVLKVCKTGCMCARATMSDVCLCQVGRGKQQYRLTMPSGWGHESRKDGSSRRSMQGQASAHTQYRMMYNIQSIKQEHSCFHQQDAMHQASAAHQKQLYLS